MAVWFAVHFNMLFSAVAEQLGTIAGVGLEHVSVPSRFDARAETTF